MFYKHWPQVRLDIFLGVGTFLFDIFSLGDIRNDSLICYIVFSNMLTERVQFRLFWKNGLVIFFCDFILFFGWRKCMGEEGREGDKLFKILVV